MAKQVVAPLLFVLGSLLLTVGPLALRTLLRRWSLRRWQDHLRKQWVPVASTWSESAVPIDADGHVAVVREGGVDIQIAWRTYAGSYSTWSKHHSVTPPSLQEELRAFLPRPFDLGMRIATSSWLIADPAHLQRSDEHVARWGEAFPYDMCVGNPVLDDLYRFSSYEPQRMLHVLTLEVRALLVEIGSQVMFVEITDDEVVFRREGAGPGGDAFLRWASWMMSRLVQALGRAEVPPLAPKRAHQTGFLRASKDLKMRFEPRSLALTGEVLGTHLLFVPRRVGPRHLGLLVRARLLRQAPFPFRWPILRMPHEPFTPPAPEFPSERGDRLAAYASPHLEQLRQLGTVRADERCLEVQLAVLQDPRDAMRWVPHLLAAVGVLDQGLDAVLLPAATTDAAQ